MPYTAYWDGRASQPIAQFQLKGLLTGAFLNGPFCPVYGVGALLVIFLLRPFTQNLLVLFVFGVLVTSVLEYITGFLLEKLFHTTWWDYSKRKFNIKGRVCLRNSLLFGVLSVLLLHFINPFVEKLEAWIPEWALPAIAFCFSLLFYYRQRDYSAQYPGYER